MADFVDSFGEYAGKIWRLLDSEGPQTEKQLIDKSGLKINEFYCAVGWLAKENKISKNDDKYILSETNLTSKIGNDAGMVWKILDMWDEVDLKSISRLAKIDENEIYCAAGWLAREDKISGKLIPKNKDNYLFCLK